MKHLFSTKIWDRDKQNGPLYADLAIGKETEAFWKIVLKKAEMVLRDTLELLDVLSRSLFFCNDSESIRLVFSKFKICIFSYFRRS